MVEQTLRQQAGTVAHEVDFVAAQLAHENDAERVVLARPEERGAVVEQPRRGAPAARSLSAPSAAWQQVLADGIQDLVADVEHDLAARLRTVLRDARDIIDESDPKDTWEDTQAWLRRQVAEAGVANRDLLLGRANELSDAVAEQFSLESGSGVELELDSVTRALAALELPSASTFAMPGGRLGSVLSSGRLAAYVPLMALSVALHTTLLIIPPAALLGAVVGRKLFQMEGKRQKAYRQGQAKAAAGKFVDEVAFEMNKDTRDGLRRTQRRLRDEFQSRAGSIQASTSAALAAARRASDLPPDVQAARAAQLDRGDPAARADPERHAHAGHGREQPDGRRPHRTHPGTGRRRQVVGDRPRGGRIADRDRRPAGRTDPAGHLRQGEGRQVDAAQRARSVRTSRPTDAGECTRIVTWYRYSDRPYATIFPVDGDPVETTYARGEDSLEVNLGGHDAEAIDHLEIGWPIQRLADVVLIDTPGIASISAEVSARTHRALSAEQGRVPVADAVLYLLRHTHSADLRFLESFHDDEVAEGTPVNTVGVLSRADEIGSRTPGRDGGGGAGGPALRDRLPAAPALPGRGPRQRPARPRGGHAPRGRVRRAGRGGAGTEGADRRPAPDGRPVRDRARAAWSRSTERARLLDRLGLFGVRLAVELVRSGAVDHLVRAVVPARRRERPRSACARSCCSSSTREPGSSRPGRRSPRCARSSSGGDCGDGPALLRRLEQITAGAHEFEEVRILLELRSGELSLTADQARELDLLMGGSGHDPGVTARVGRGSHDRRAAAGRPRGARQVAGGGAAPAVEPGHPDRCAGRDPDDRGHAGGLRSGQISPSRMA